MFAQNKIRERLNREHPRLFTEKYGWLYLTMVTAFIGVYISHQQPYGLYIWQNPYKWWILSCFGIIPGPLYALIYELLPRIFSHFFAKANWTIKKEIATLCIFFLIAGTANWGFALMELSYFRASVDSFLRVQMYTLETGIAPILLLSLLVRQRNEKRKYMEINELFETIIQNITVVSTELKFVFNKRTFDLTKVIYINKCVNSLQFHVFQQDECVIYTCPGTIKQLLPLLKDYKLMIQTHGSFVVNKKYIKDIKGNSNNKEIRFRDCEDIVPVSRHFIPQVERLFPHH